MDFKMRHRIVIVIERNMLMVIERLPYVVRAPVVHPKRILRTLRSDFCGVPGPGLWGRDETGFARGSLKSTALVHANRADRNAVHDARWRLNSVGPEPAKQVIGDARVALDRITSIALELIARVD